MKRIFLLVLFFSLFSLCAQEINYPVIMNNGTILINTGIGFGRQTEAKRKCPPLTASVDFALPLAGLPFTVGLISGYFSEAGEQTELNGFLIAGRIAYHQNFNIPRFDSYLVLTLGGIAAKLNDTDEGYFWPGVSIGARYFFLPSLGAFAELGFDKVQNISFGLSFKL